MFHLYSDKIETITIFVFLFADPRWEKLSLWSTDFRLKKNFRSFRCRKRDSWTKTRSADWGERRTRSWGSSESFSGDYFNLFWCSAIFFLLSVSDQWIIKLAYDDKLYFTFVHDLINFDLQLCFFVVHWTDINISATISVSFEFTIRFENVFSLFVLFYFLHQTVKLR